MGNNNESAKLSAHRRWHVRKGITNSGCSYCIQEKNLPPEVQLQPDPDSFYNTINTAPAKPFNTTRARGMAEIRKTLQECATVFEMSPREFKQQVKAALNINWDELARTAPLQLLTDIERMIFERARGGDIRFTMLLIRCKKLPGWHEEAVFTTPTQDERVIEMLPEAAPQDLRSLSTQELQDKLTEIKRQKLIDVIDQPSRLQNSKHETYEIRNATPQEEAIWHNEVKAPLFMPDPDADERQPSSTFMQVNLD